MSAATFSLGADEVATDGAATGKQAVVSYGAKPDHHWLECDRESNNDWRVH